MILFALFCKNIVFSRNTCARAIAGSERPLKLALFAMAGAPDQGSAACSDRK